MSELTIEQKAKLYDEVIERGNSLLSCNELGNAWVYKLLPELESKDERIKKSLIEYLKERKSSESYGQYVLRYDRWITWLEKQEQSKKTSIWKHWKNGIAGNGEGKLTFLIKSGPTYSLSSCLSFECDYIELSELDNLMLEKQDNLTDIANKEYWRGYKEGKQEVLDKYSELEKQIVQNINIPWHDVSEEPEVHREIFCEWKGYADNIWHDVAFYHLDDKAFWNGERPIPDVIKWAYIDDMLKEQSQSQFKPKFKPGDTIQCVSDETDKRTIAEIDTLYNVYRCENNYPIPFTQENMWKLESKFKVGDWITDGNITIQIEAIKNNCYLYSGDCTLYSIKTVDKVYHLWNIADAKDGDILAASDGSVFIFERVSSYSCIHYIAVDTSGELVFNRGLNLAWESINGVKPATKEQRDLLFQKINEAGFEWDSNKKKLHKHIEKIY